MVKFLGMPSVMSIELFKQLIQVFEALGSVITPQMQHLMNYAERSVLSVTAMPPPSLAPLAPTLVLVLDASITSSNLESSS